MTTPTHHLHADAAARHARGARDIQLDAVHVGTHVFAVADGFGASPSASAAAVTAVADLEGTQHDAPPAAALEAAVARAAVEVDRVARTALYEAYIDRLTDCGNADLHIERALDAFRLQQVLREIVYAGRHLPRWMYVPDAALPALLHETSR